MVVVTEVPPILPYVVTHRVFLGLFSIPCHFGGGIFIPDLCITLWISGDKILKVIRQDKIKLFFQSCAPYSFVIFFN
jgi:hypothetical protein